MAAQPAAGAVLDLVADRMTRGSDEPLEALRRDLSRMLSALRAGTKFDPQATWVLAVRASRCGDPEVEQAGQALLDFLTMAA